MQYIASHPEGTSLRVEAVSGLPFIPSIMLERRVSDTGVLLICQLKENTYLPYWSGVRAIWYPIFGAGGWVDVNKDQEARQACEAWSNTLEQQALNCMAL